jgi:hypothetical protein
VVIEVLIFILIITLGLFKDNAIFQFPAAATLLIFLAVVMMVAGAFTYWFGGWAGTISLIIFLFVNYLYGENFFSRRYEAFGLIYDRQPAAYTIDAF